MDKPETESSSPSGDGPQLAAGNLISPSSRYLMLLTLGALGVVYGDIGTSPLYAMRECFTGHHGIPLNQENVIGVLSLIIWTLIFLVSVKYLGFVLRADNKGEGGVLALMALLQPALRLSGDELRRSALYFGLFGAALLYGDGAITPAISVLGAVEGLRVATPIFGPYVVPIAIVILLALFLVQRRGTGRIGTIFGPIILLWFITIAVLGVRGIFLHPQVLLAISPHRAVEFVLHHGHAAFMSLGAIFLVATGAEALYADMGHFGRRPIRLGWFAVALPALALNYMGQAALLIERPEAVENPFYQLAPSWFVIPLVAIATAAAVIASQALISGAFSLTSQAVQLGFLPRLEILHTSSREIGQIYIPVVNYILLLLTIYLVLAFGSASELAAAYGLAVSFTMLITTFLLYFTARKIWRWNSKALVALFGAFFAMDAAFFGANALKFFDGGWVPFAMAIVVFTIMTTWHRGREILADRLREGAMNIEKFVRNLKQDSTIRVPGVAIFMSRDIDRVPNALLHNVRHNKVVHKTVLLLRVLTEEDPHVSNEERIQVDEIDAGFYRVTIRYGFMETPDVPVAVASLPGLGVPLDPAEITYFLGRETVLPSNRPGMEPWREELFAFMTKLASRANKFYQVPASQVIEIGSQVEI